jgi:3-carboxy-cis,cis-muconate cycloisomerase
MASTMFDSDLFRDMFGTKAMREVFSDRGYLACCLEVEAALARAQAAVGMIPAGAAREITAKATIDGLDFDRLRQECEVVGYPIIGLVKQLAAACDGDAGGYVHWGATTQDIMDTAVVLQVRQALDLMAVDLQACADLLRTLALRHRDVPMAGRTHLQHALPITFGFKAAIWRDPLVRHLQRLEQLRPRVLTGQFGGAAGTLASLGKDGLAVRAALMRELGLREPEITWHVTRDNLAEAVLFTGLVTGSLAKIGTDVMLMMATEFAEAFEPYQHGRGASSTMPQKRNPISCLYIHSTVALVRQHVAALLEAAVADHERSTGPWEIEWIALPEIFLLSSGALAQTRDLVSGLQVDEKQMRANLDLTHGNIVSEAVMMGLGPHLGRQRAHDLVYDVCRKSATTGQPLADLLAKDAEISKHVSRAELDKMCDPANYLGLSGEMVDRVLAREKAR